MPALEFEVYCECGEGLCRQSEVDHTYGRKMPFLKIEPCKECLKKERAEGFDEGKEEGEAEGYKKGHEDAQSEAA